MKTGVQRREQACLFPLKILDAGFRRHDEKKRHRTCCALCFFGYSKKKNALIKRFVSQQLLPLIAYQNFILPEVSCRKFSVVLPLRFYHVMWALKKKAQPLYLAVRPFKFQKKYVVALLFLLAHHRRNYFKHPSGNCLQRRAALKGCIDHVDIAVIELYNLSAQCVFCKGSVTK